MKFKRREQRLDFVRELFGIENFSEEEKTIRATVRTVVFTTRTLKLGKVVKALQEDWIEDIAVMPFSDPSKSFQVTVFFDHDYESYVDGKRTEKE